MDTKSYFFQTRLATGEYVNLMYSSAHRKGTNDHLADLQNAIDRNNIKIAHNEIHKGKNWRDTFVFIHLANRKNLSDMCADDYRTIVLE